jgi:hypothetical protein
MSGHTFLHFVTDLESFKLSHSIPYVTVLAEALKIILATLAVSLAPL